MKRTENGASTPLSNRKDSTPLSNRKDQLKEIVI